MSIETDDARTDVELVGQALDEWVALTGVKMEDDRISLRDWDIRSMNTELKETLNLDPSGVSTWLMLECFLREYLEAKTFTAASIMKDYQATTAFLKQAEHLFSLVQSDRGAEITAQFRARVTSGLARYGADRPEVLELLAGPEALAFLRRDALRSLETLKPYQFLQGPGEAGVAQVVDHVYLAWNVNDLLFALRDMPVSGIALVLLRDPSHPDRSWFSFAMRNGGNVTIFADRSRPAFPGQEDVFATRGARAMGRSFASRQWKNHFPYQLVKHHYDDRGDVVFDRETAPVMSGSRLVPLMRIADLPPHQAIWTTMMLSLVADRFWRKTWQAPALSYSAAMIRNKGLLITDDSGTSLPVASGYQPITLENLRREDVTAQTLADQVIKQYGINDWLEARYRDRVDEVLLNLQPNPDTKPLMLPRKIADQPRFGHAMELVPSAQGAGVVVCPEKPKHGSWSTPGGYGLLTLSPTEFGTEEEIRRDQVWIARYNMARAIQKMADEEYEARKEDVLAWFKEHVSQNMHTLYTLTARTHLGDWQGVKDVNALVGGRRLIHVEDPRARNEHYFDRILFGRRAFDFKPYCMLTEAASVSWRVTFTPRNSEDLALMAGCDVETLPDVLRHWTEKTPYVGNSILTRLDPMDYNLEDPWRKLRVGVEFHLSKRAMNQITAEVLKQTPSDPQIGIASDEQGQEEDLPSP